VVVVSNIHLHIDRLILPAMDVGERNALIQGLQAELRRALADPATRAAWARSHRTPVLRLGRMQLETGPSGGGQFGAALGSSIAKGLKP
jgi:hypothetical protein